MPVNFFFETGDSINYELEDAYLGYSNTYGIGLTLKPSKRLQLGTELQQADLLATGPTATGNWDYNVVREKATYQLNKTLSLRAIVDYNFFEEEAFGSLLASWVLRPGSVFFLGFDKRYLPRSEGSPVPNPYNVFVKFSYWWRL